MKTRLTVISVLAATIGIYYGRFYNVFFTYDDFMKLSSVVQGFKPALLSNNEFRLLSNVAWFVLYSLFGLDAEYYFLFSITVHIINLYLFALFIEKIFDRKIAGMAVLAFGCMTVYADIIFWHNEFSGLLSFMFIILSLYFYTEHRTSRKTGRHIFSVCLAACAILSKEDGLIIPLLVIIIEKSIYKENDAGKILRRASPYFGVVLTFLIINRIIWSSESGPWLTTVFSPEYLLFGGFSPLFMDLNGQITVSLLTAGQLLIVLYSIMKRELRDKALFCCAWIFIAFIPASFATSPTGLYWGESNRYLISSLSRNLYISCSGLAVLMGLFFSHVSKLKTYVVVYFILFILLNAQQVWNRGIQWQQDPMKGFLVSLKRSLPEVPDNSWFYLENWRRSKHVEGAIQALYRNSSLKILRDLSDLENIDYKKYPVFSLYYTRDSGMSVSRAVASAGK